MIAIKHLARAGLTIFPEPESLFLTARVDPGTVSLPVIGKVQRPHNSDTLFNLWSPMGKPLDDLACPTQPHWDMAFTRLSRQFLSHVDLCVTTLSPAFQAHDLWVDQQVRQTPRGLSAFLAVAGEQGLLFILDFTLVDGMTIGRFPGAAVDVRLLDASGDVLAQCPPVRAESGQSYYASFEQILAGDGQCLQAATVYAMTTTFFDVAVRPA